jgi:hypothetical protein
MSSLEPRALCRMTLLVLLACLPSWASRAASPIVIPATGTNFGSAVLELQTEELVTMTAIPFRLLIGDADGKPVTGLHLLCDMSMPSMVMPENRPKATERDGAYTGVMIFTCAQGAWRIVCYTDKSDGERRSATFDIERVKLK